MTAFWISAAALLLLALGLVLPTLLRRRGAAESPAHGTRRANLAILTEQLGQLDADLAAGAIDATQHRAQREEIERRVLDEEGVDEAPRTAAPARKTAWALAVVLPLATLAAYAVFGNVAALDPSTRHAQAAPGGDVTMAQVEEMVDKLAQRLKNEPKPGNGDLEGWTMLARSYTALQRFDDARRAYDRAIAMAPDSAQLYADQADVTGALQGQTLAGEPERLIAKALQLDPRHPKALALAGGAAYEKHDFDGAARYWRLAREGVPPDSDFARGLDASIVDATAAAQRVKAGSAGAAPAGAKTAAAGAAPDAAAPASTAQVSGRVSLAPALAQRAAPGDTVFVFARAAEGPRVPLAVLRRTVADLPLEFTLDDSMAMSPQFKLSSFPLVVVGARVSKSGNATPQSGDLQGSSAPLKIGSRGLEIVIDSVQP